MALTKELIKLKNIVLSLFDLSSFTNLTQSQKISVNILCKNNAKSILICLESVINCVDEIIIIDTGSNDGTIELIKNFFKLHDCQYKLIEEQNFKGYSHHRNQAIKESSGNWILVLDSDEYLSKDFQNQLRTLCSSCIFSAYKIFRRWISQIDSQEAWFTNTKKFKGRYKSIIRLFKKSESVEYRGEIHEAVFGLEKKRIKNLNEKLCFYHLDVAINNYETRKNKVEQREKLLKGSGHAEEYLPENFDIEYQKVPYSDFINLDTIKGKISQKTS